MSYEGEPDEKPKIYGDPSETGIFDDEYDCMEQSYSINGHCPCCGGYTRTIGGNYEGQPQQEICDDCVWKGAIDYE